MRRLISLLLSFALLIPAFGQSAQHQGLLGTAKPAVAACFGSLVFGGAVSHRVDCGSATGATGVDDVVPFTMIVWVFPTTFTVGRPLMQKGRFGTSSAKAIVWSGADEIAVTVYRATVVCQYITNNANITTGKWWLIAVTYDPNAGAGEVVNIYVGDETTAATERTYGTATDGSGTTASDAADSLFLGNNPAVDSSFPGSIAVASYFPSVLSQAEIQAWQDSPIVGTVAGARGYWNLNNTSSVTDGTGNGNTGTVTGCTAGTTLCL